MHLNITNATKCPDMTMIANLARWLRPLVKRLNLTLAAAFVALLSASAVAAGGDSSFGRVELDTKSNYSHIRVYRQDNVRTLVFVRDSGEEAIESQVDLDKPFELRFAYLKYMFGSYLVRPQQEKVLIIGLGGGSMVHFLRRYAPKAQVEVVEIDPAIVNIADKYFNIRPDDNVKILTADGVKHLQSTEERYDAIYMDAFLKPSAKTDSTGAPLRLRTIRFYAEVKKRLNPGGVVAFNLNPHAKVEDDLRVIREAFRQTYVFRLSDSEGIVAMASDAPKREDDSTLRDRAKELDQRGGAGFSFESMLRHLDR
jgi:spermidine synthase